MSSEDFKSLIVTDPDLIDEGIDVSGLRTQTDTNPRLLGSIGEYPGISYDPTSYNYLDDLNRLYAAGLPEIDTSQPTTPAPPPGNGGGGGGGGGGGTAPDNNSGFNPGVTPGPSGFIGIDPEYDLDPRDYIDDPTYSPFTPTYGITSDPIQMEDLINYQSGDDPTGLDMSGTIRGRPEIFDINKVGDPSQNPGSTNVGDQFVNIGVEGEDSDRFNSISTIANPEIFDRYVDDPQIGDPGFTGYVPSSGTPGQDSPDMDDGIGLTKVELDQIQDSSLKGQLSDIFTNAKNLGKSATEVTQELIDKGVGTYNNLNKTVNVPLLGEIDVGQTLGGIALNAAVGAPVSLLMYAMRQMPESKSQIEYAGYTDAQKAAVDEAYGPGGVMEGYNAVSAFGKGPLETITERYKTRVGNGIIDTTTTDLANAINALGGDVDTFEDRDEDTDNTVDDTDISVEGLDDETGRFTDTTVDNISPGYSPDDDDPGDDGNDRDDGPGDTTDASGTEGEDQDRFGGGQDAGQSDFSGGNVTDSKSGDTYGGEAYGYNEAAEKGNDSGGGGDGCFIKGTLITMADGSTKPVEQVDLKDNVAEGGKVFATGKFLIKNLYDYKGIKVSGSHMVHEDSNWVRVEDSKQGKPLGNDEHTVYVFGSENRRILINDILFTDYFEVNEQNILMKDSEDFFNNSKNYGKIIDKQNVDILNAS